jgi:pyruvate dehydrogenase E1 component beta subunit
VVFRGPAGTGNQLSAQHSQSLEAWFVHTPGLKVAMPSNAQDAKGLLKTAIRDDSPVIFMEHAGLYAQRGDVPDDPEFTVPFGSAVVRRPGADVTVVAYSAMVGKCVKAADALAADGIECEIVDLRTLVPLDMETVLSSVRKTHRAVVVQEEWRNLGVAAEIAARIGEQAFDDLDAPIERVGGADVPMPYAKNLERAAIPGDQDIVAAVRRVVR